jgi:hypothetical protein
MSEPEKPFNVGNCRAAVFANEIQQDGKKSVVKKVAIQKSYKDKDGKWQSNSSFGVNNLPKLILVGMKAYDYLTRRDIDK